jgi:hypothetical protein
VPDLGTQQYRAEHSDNRNGAARQEGADDSNDDDQSPHAP